MHRLRLRHLRLLATSMTAALALTVTACGYDETAPDSLAAAPVDPQAARRTPYQLDPLFDQAAEEHAVPVELLLAVSYVETRWEMVQGHEELPGLAPAHGLMALRGATLEHGAALAGVTADAARTEPLANLRAGAALLSAYADELSIEPHARQDLAAWAPAVARLSGLTSDDAQAEHVYEIYSVLRRGAVAHTPEGQIAASLAPVDVESPVPAPVRQKASGPDYAGSIWRPSPNYNARPTGSIGVPAMVVVHSCEGSYSSCWSWLTNSASQASAHYVVKEDGSEISQLVREADRAWHVAATYDCGNNSGVDCWRNGYSSNHFTIGIEHGGYASQKSWPTSQIDASARLVCDISRDRSIPRDRYHILSHAQLQPNNRTDPGADWPWTDYLNRINNYCSDNVIIVDSNNSNNDPAKASITVSSNWITSTGAPGYYGSGYWYASTQAISDPATFSFYLPAPATKTIDAWWAASSNRSPNTPFIIQNASGTNLATVYANQQVNGGQWNTLGTWSFPAGWNKVLVSRWTGSGYVVIADAIRVR